MTGALRRTFRCSLALLVLLGCSLSTTESLICAGEAGMPTEMIE